MRFLGTTAGVGGQMPYHLARGWDASTHLGRDVVIRWAADKREADEEDVGLGV